jgi:hypothetical protein
MSCEVRGSFAMDAEEVGYETDPEWGFGQKDCSFGAPLMGSAEAYAKVWMGNQTYATPWVSADGRPCAVLPALPSTAVESGSSGDQSCAYTPMHHLDAASPVYVSPLEAPWTGTPVLCSPVGYCYVSEICDYGLCRMIAAADAEGSGVDWSGAPFQEALEEAVFDEDRYYEIFPALDAAGERK